MRMRKARVADVPSICRLIEHYAAQGLLLPRAEDDVCARLESFRVQEQSGGLAGCAALESYSAELAEIRSLAVDPESRGQGIGSQLLQSLLSEAKRRRIARVFAVTHAPQFFVRQGFHVTARYALPEKIERDCIGCPRRRNCALVAVVAPISRERVALPLIHGLAVWPSPA